MIKMAAHIPLIQLRRIKYLLDSDDEYTREVSNLAIHESKITRLWGPGQGQGWRWNIAEH